MYRYFVTLLLLLCPLLLFCACGDSPEQKKRNQQCIETAKVNAQDYLRQKYGFEADITDAVLERRYLWIGTAPLTTVYLRMQYGGRNFGVYIDGSQPNTDGYDNYQADQLRAAVQADCEAMLPGVQYVWMDSNEVQTSYDPIEKECINMHHACFDGTNAAELLCAARGSLQICYVGTNFSRIPDNNPLRCYCQNSPSRQVKLLSYRSEEAMQTEREHGYLHMPAGSPLYCDASCLITVNEHNICHAETSRLELGEYDGFFYYVQDSSPETVSFEKITPPDGPICWGEQYIGDASSAYAVRARENCNVTIYYPVDRIDGYHPDFYLNKAHLATCRIKDGEKYFYADASIPTTLPYHHDTLSVNAEAEMYFLYLKHE